MFGVCLDYKRLISTRTPLYPAHGAFLRARVRDRIHTTLTRF